MNRLVSKDIVAVITPQRWEMFPVPSLISSRNSALPTSHTAERQCLGKVGDETEALHQISP